MKVEDIHKILADNSVEGFALEIPKGVPKELLERVIANAVEQAVHEAGMCECQQGNIPKVKELRNESNNKLRASLSAKIDPIEQDIEDMIDTRNAFIDLIEILDQDPDPDDKAACAAHGMEVAAAMVGMLRLLTASQRRRDRT